MTTMTDADLAAWRAKRTGKAVSFANSDTANKGPAGQREARSPVENLKDGFDPTKGGLTQDDVEAAQAAIDAASATSAAATAQKTEDDDGDFKQQLSALQGRASSAQRQAEELRAAVEAANRRAAEAEARAKELEAAQRAAALAKEAAEFDPLEGYSQEELDRLDPGFLKILKDTNRRTYERARKDYKDPAALIQQALAERDARAKNNLIKSTADQLNLEKLGDDPKFQKFLQEDDSAGLLINSFVNAPDVDTVKLLAPRMKTLISRYEKSTVSTTRTPDPKSQLANHMERSAPSGAAAGGGGVLTAERVKAITQEARQLTRAGKHKEAKELLRQITT